MKVVLIERNPSLGGHSIEALFDQLGAALSKRIEVVRIRWYGWRHLFDFMRKVYAERADIYHITGDVNYLALVFLCGRVVITVHDIDHYNKTLRGWRRLIYRFLWFDLPLRRAAAIVAVSQTTAHLMVRKLGIDPRRIEVIENFISADFQPIPKWDLSDPPVILQLGTGPQKNLERLFSALSGQRCRLVLIGQMTPDQRALLDESDVEFANYSNISCDEVIAQYGAADIVTFASLYEGFGLPIVEAQAIGRPVITSNRPPMTDVAGDGAMLIDPEDTGAYRAALVSLLEDPLLRADLVERGTENARRFSLDAAVQAYLDLYHRLSLGEAVIGTPK